MRRALITGGSSGLGRSLVSCFLENGFEVIALSRRGTSAAGARDYTVDLEDAAALENFIRMLSASVEHLDILINNAAQAPAARLLNATEKSFDSAVAVNFTAPRLLMNGLSRKLAGGMVVNILSRTAMEGRIGLSAYAASKGLLWNYTQSAAREFAPLNIRVMGVNPGFMRTGMTTDAAARTQQSESLLGRISRSDDQAALIFKLWETGFSAGRIIDLDSRASRSWMNLS